MTISLFSVIQIELPPPTLRLEVGDSGLGPDSLSWFPIQCKQDVSRFIGRDSALRAHDFGSSRPYVLLHSYIATQIRKASSRIFRQAFSSR